MSLTDFGLDKIAKTPPNRSDDSDLSSDPRWQLIERIVASEAFQKSSRLPALLRYLAQRTIVGDRNGLSEQSIGCAVFQKGKDYAPIEDSSVRVYMRQLRIRLHEFYHQSGQSESMVVDVPKGGYALSFTTITPKLPAVVPSPSRRSSALVYLLLGVSTFLAGGWFYTATSQHRVNVLWPINQLVAEKTQATVVLADAGYALRLLGDKPVSLDQYIDRSFAKQVLPEHRSHGEVRLFNYLSASRITSLADAEAAAALSQLAGPFAQNLVFRSARDLGPNDLTHGNLIFVGANTSNPWVRLFDGTLNFHLVEDFPDGGRYISNRAPKAGEQARYGVWGSTGTSGEDFAAIALLPNGNGSGKILLIQGLRMEGTEAAISLLRNDALRTLVQNKLAAANQGKLPAYFEVLLRAQSVAGAPVAVECIAVRALGR